jgi:bla regulator protein blaR1
MNAWLAGMNQVAATGLAALLNTLWCAGAVVGLTWVGLRYLPRVNAATRYWIWTAVLGFLLVLPFLPGLVKQARAVLVERPEATAVIEPLARVPVPSASTQLSAPVTLTVNTNPGSTPWPLWLLAAWMIAAGWQLKRLLRGVASVRRLKARADISPSVSLPISPQRHERVLTSVEVGSPVAVGYFDPAVIVPPGLLASLEEGERQDVLLHELAHLARYDDWMALATRALGAILVLHPLAAIVLGRIEREREMACDDFVVTRTGSARRYARSLARLHDLRWTAGTRLLAPGLFGGNSSLADRIESLLQRGRGFSARPSLGSLGVSTFLLVLLLGAGGLIPGWVAIAQTAIAWPQSFEAASIKPAKPSGRGFGLHETTGRFWATGALDKMIIYAYQIEQEQLEGLPAWARTRRYTIEAVAPPALASDIAMVRKLTPDQRKLAILAERQSDLQRIRSLLVDRFKLRVHEQIKQLPVYEMILAKSGSKLRPANAPDFIAAHHKPDSGSHVDGGSGHLNALGTPMPTLALLLSRELGRTVIDKTGLTGRYDFTLTWAPWRSGGGRMLSGSGYSGAEKPGTATALASDTSGPSIFTAIQQQLGLKLKPARGPVEVLVIDHVEQPSAN